jgi:hypothetical protein
MNRIDYILEDVQKLVELYGKSGLKTVFKDNLQFSIDQEDFDVPLMCNAEEARSDVDWFFKCADVGRVVSHPNPDNSFWVRVWGKDALPYGYTWNLYSLKEMLNDHLSWRRAVLYNHRNPASPPCITCYQFQQIDYNTLDCTVTMRSSDVVRVLPQDVYMTGLILERVCSFVDMEPGKMTFNLANAHVFYEDLEYQEEFVIDYGD